jgi:hypothetical protein
MRFIALFGCFALLCMAACGGGGGGGSVADKATLGTVSAPQNYTVPTAITTVPPQ